MNWDKACAARNLDAGQVLAENVRTCLAALPPEATAYVWSDMFDPYHNAVDHYYLVNGTLAGSQARPPRGFAHPVTRIHVRSQRLDRRP